MLQLILEAKPAPTGIELTLACGHSAIAGLRDEPRMNWDCQACNAGDGVTYEERFRQWQDLSLAPKYHEKAIAMAAKKAEQEE